MNQITPDFLLKSRNAFLSNGPFSLQDIRDRVADQGSGTQRRDTLSALDSVARLFGRDLARIPAGARSIRDLFLSRTAAELGVTDKRYANIRSCVTTALKAYGEAPTAITKRIPLTPEWQALLDRIEKRTYRMALYRLASFCSFMNVAPAAVTAEVLLGFHHALEAEEIVKDPRRLLKYTISHWNMCQKRVPGWPDFKLHSPFDCEVVSLPLANFPRRFQQDLDRWVKRITDPDPLDPEAPSRPLRASTVKSHVDIVVRFASALVHRGDLASDQITGLAVLVEIDHFKSGLRFFLERAGNSPTPYIARVATILRSIARYHCRLGEPQLDELTAICRRVDSRQPRQITARNRERLRQFDDPSAVARFLAFPAEERARGLKQKNPLRAAKCFERALAVGILIDCVLRIQNLRTIDMTTDLSWAGGKCFLSIDASRVKNRQALEFELTDDVAGLLKEYVRDHRPRLAGAHGPYLFPGRDGGPRPHNTMRGDFEKAMRQRAGLVMHPHLVRHAIAKIVVERDPGLYVPMSRQLGHKRIDMTMAHYLGTETRAAGRHINKLLREALAHPENPEDKADD